MTYENPVHYCPIVGQRRFLEVCQHLVVKRKEQGPLNECYFQCSVAINKHRCPVVKQLFPKKGDDDVLKNGRDVADKGDTGTPAPRSTSKTKSRKVSSGNGHKGKVVRKKKLSGDSVLLPPLRKQGVPKNSGKVGGRSNKNTIKASKGRKRTTS